MYRRTKGEHLDIILAEFLDSRFEHIDAFLVEFVATLAKIVDGIFPVVFVVEVVIDTVFEMVMR